VAGLAVALPAAPEAETPAREGIEKKVFSHATGEVDAMVASFVSVTVSWLFAPTVNAVVRECELPLVVVA
jgi:hypothetical protein